MKRFLKYLAAVTIYGVVASTTFALTTEGEPRWAVAMVGTLACFVGGPHFLRMMR